MNRVEYLKSLPSYFSGSLRQTLATLGKPVAFAPKETTPVVLLPGAFCTASVMNRLGEQIEARGRGVVLAPNFPYYYSALANLCRIDQAVELFVEWLAAFRRETGVEQVDVAAHSNGGLITLLAHRRMQADPDGASVRVRKLVTMATPFGGMPGARALSLVIPCCRDLVDGSAVRDRAAAEGDLVARFLVSAADSLIPPDRQFLDSSRRTVMEGFQHMDFIVGTGDKVGRAAEEVVRWLGNDC